MNKIGIDFGTSNCSVSYVKKTGEAKSIRIDGAEKIPSMLLYSKDDNKPLVGQAAYAFYEQYAEKPISEEIVDILGGIFEGIKRDMNPDSTRYLPNGEKITYVELIAEIFRFIKQKAEVHLESTIDEVVITHPVVFEQYKQEMLSKAAHMAGFKTIDLLLEPVAAAMGYINGRKKRKLGVLVYDFGGGTFDVSFVQFDKDGDFFIPVEPSGDQRCGGKDIDKLVFDEWNKVAEYQHKRKFSSFFLNSRCTKHKEGMSKGVMYDFMEILPAPGISSVKLSFSKERFATIIEPIIDRTIHLTLEHKEAVEKLGYNIDKVIFIGGSSNLPMVQERIKDIFPTQAQQVMDWDVAVAHGAALYTRRDLVIAKDIYCMECGSKISTAHRFCMFDGNKNPYYDIRFDNR